MIFVLMNNNESKTERTKYYKNIFLYTFPHTDWRKHIFFIFKYAHKRIYSH